MEFKDLVLLARAAKGGGGSIADTYLLLMSDGKEIPAVVVEEETVFTATANDIREGMVAATESGVTVGTKVIPSYNTTEGYNVILPGAKMAISLPSPLKLYDYTKLQAVICELNTSLEDSVAAAKVSLEDKTFDVLSTEPLANVIKDEESETIDLGIVNDSEKTYIIRFFTFKEIY